MKIYTGMGDKGKTSLFSGERVAKCDTRIEAYGDVDELSSVLGALAASMSSDEAERVRQLQHVQSILLQAGAWLATSPGSPSEATLGEVHPDEHKLLETAIDEMQEGLPALTGFILPGGHPTAAWAHVARTVCRRAERRVVRQLESLSEGKAADQVREVVVYLNRLSDYLFVLARHCNLRRRIAEVPWK